MYLDTMFYNEYSFIDPAFFKITSFLSLQRFGSTAFFYMLCFLYLQRFYRSCDFILYIVFTLYRSFYFSYIYIFIFPVVLNLQRFFLLWYNSTLFIFYSVYFIFAYGTNWGFSIFSYMFLFFLYI